MDFDNINENQENLNEALVEDKTQLEVEQPPQEAPSEEAVKEIPSPYSTVQHSFADAPSETQTKYDALPPYSQNRTNEYIYNGYEPVPKKKSNAGKITLGIIAGVLAVFVISIMSISAYVSLTGNDFNIKNYDRGNKDNNVGDNSVGDNSVVFSPLLPNSPDNSDNSALTDDANKDNNGKIKDNKVPNTDKNIDNKVYPTLEQLAAPKDAMGLPDIYDKVSPSVVGVSCTMTRGSATGTGIIISENGYIITNAHVIENAVKVVIVDKELNEYEATIIGSDEQTDLAVLKIDATGLTACEFGSSGDLRIGELAVVIGNPLGFELYGTMTSGIISGLNRSITISDKKMTLIQTNASINNGNSGGPLINSYGQIIGVTSAKVASVYGEGLGFAIPIDEAIPIIKDLMQYGYVTGRPVIGISCEDITAIISMYYRLPQGVCVRFVTPDSGAEKAGIKAGDIIVGVNGQSITTMDELTSIKNGFSAGDTITLTVYRDGANIDLDLVLGEVTQEAKK